jgi:arylsulfatase A-like enzyme
MASEVDTAVGEFVGMLQAKGMWEDTILWVTTDNGGMTTGPRYDEADVSRAWSATSNFPLRGGKVREKLNDCSLLLRPMPYG